MTRLAALTSCVSLHFTACHCIPLHSLHSSHSSHSAHLRILHILSIQHISHILHISTFRTLLPAFPTFPTLPYIRHIPYNPYVTLHSSSPQSSHPLHSLQSSYTHSTHSLHCWLVAWLSHGSLQKLGVTARCTSLESRLAAKAWSHGSLDGCRLQSRLVKLEYRESADRKARRTIARRRPTNQQQATTDNRQPKATAGNQNKKGLTPIAGDRRPSNVPVGSIG